GQGASTLIRFPGEKVILVDGGGFYGNAFDVGRYVVAPYLWHERISTIHTVVLTHPHPDHLNGLLYILENFNVREVWTNGAPAEGDTGDAFEEIIERRKILRRCLSGRTGPMEIDGVTIEWLNPFEPLGKDEDDTASFDETNDSALVMRLTYKDVHCLMPSDISSSIEEDIIRRKPDMRSPILLVPHHGSRRSSSDAFLNSVKPRIAVLSVGKDNPFRLPHPDTLARYRSRGIPILRTDLHGAVTIETDGDRIDVRSFK
ncbi:MAG: ComEC/Rec2 family competence protein, partial [Syntrophales bacterium]|nr:ComEC/Rec2 family competence protein [Syntrophales bacterium]